MSRETELSKASSKRGERVNKLKAGSHRATGLLLVVHAFISTTSTHAFTPQVTSLPATGSTHAVVRELSSQIELKLYFSNPRLPEWANSCGAGEFVKRTVRPTSRPADAALRLLFAGPTADEKARGMESIEALGRYYRGVSIKKGGVAVVNFLWFVVFVWLVSLVLTLYVRHSQKPLPPANDLSLTADDAPLVSILVPARNEEHRVLAESVRSILSQDYGRFEVIAVDDRSTDATYAILKSLAKTDGRLRVIEGKELPAGWLGKPYAMQQALSHAQGEWILATDADMIFDKAALRTAIAAARAREADAITLIPHFEAGSFWERVMIPTWSWVLSMFTISYRINNPKTQGALGIGGFFLMHRTLLDRVGGYEALKDEVLEDVRLAEMIKRSGGKLLAEYAPGLVSTRMYSTFGEMWESCTKSWFAGMKFSLPFALLCVCWIYFIAVIPPVVALTTLIAIATGSDGELWRVVVPATLSWLLQVVVLMPINLRSGFSPAYALTAPLGLALLYTMLLESSIRITIGKGVKWKGRKIYERAGVSPPQPGTLAARVPRIER